MTFKVTILALLPMFTGVLGSVVSRQPENVPDSASDGLSCEYFNKTCLDMGVDKDQCQGKQVCPSTSHNCFVVWNKHQDTDANHRSGNVVELMGCLDDDTKCDATCSAASGKRGKLFCCCLGDMCNANFTHDLLEETTSTTMETPTDQLKVKKKPTTLFNFIYAIIPVIIVSVVLAVCFYVYRQRKNAQFNAVQANDNLQTFPAGNGGPDCDRELVPLQPIELVEIKARGRFGAVWKGRIGRSNDCKIVAVKIFPLQDKNSWQAEKEIYNLPRMDHENVLKFLGAETRGENLQTEFWLTSEFHENGSLCDFLKSNVVSWEDLCKIALSMARGLTHLHEEIAKSGTRDMKPAIAHRDFKSKNVLIKSDMTACVADFGLALIFEPGKSCGDTHGQVGTRRYMAPEVLEGAINFSRDAFLRIDMYACGLVLWELASRCTIVRASPVNTPPPLVLSTHCTNLISTTAQEEYKLPFEEEASNPSLEKMQDLVVNNKMRPQIKPEWRLCPGMSALCDTIEECWDQDAEARLSASCVMERVRNFQRLNQTFTSGQNNRLFSEENRMNAINAQQTAAIASPVRQRQSEVEMDRLETVPLLIMNPNLQECCISSNNALDSLPPPRENQDSS